VAEYQRPDSAIVPETTLEYNGRCTVPRHFERHSTPVDDNGVSTFAASAADRGAQQDE